MREDEQCVCYIEAVLRLRQAYISQQLMTLRKAGLVSDRKDGLRVYYRITNRAVLKVLDPARAIVGHQGETFPRIWSSTKSWCAPGASLRRPK